MGLTNQTPAETIRELHPCSVWACGAAGSALPWHGRGHRFDPGQVHQSIQAFRSSSLPRPCRILVANSKTLPETVPGLFFPEGANESVVVAAIVTTAAGLTFLFAGFDPLPLAP